jgi:hypothetical protein
MIEKQLREVAMNRERWPRTTDPVLFGQTRDGSARANAM